MAVFGNFYERIHGSVEFLASESLNYILNSSDKVSKNLVNMINLDTNCHYENIRFTSQVQGADKEIPDLSGYDKNRTEVIILETKFWASLTKNQPMTYLDRLDNKGVLAFICPDLRTISLKTEIENVLIKKDKKFSYLDEDKKIISIENKFIVIYTWENILNCLKNDLDNSNFEILSDINQLQGLCKRIDTDLFISINEQDLSPEIPKKIMSYVNIVDKTITKLAGDEEVKLSTFGYKATAVRWGYRRYAQIGNLLISLDTNWDYWSKYADTPLWIELFSNQKNTEAVQKLNNELEKKHGKINFGDPFGNPYYPIRLKIGDIEDKVIEAICDFIKELFKIYKKNI